MTAGVQQVIADYRANSSSERLATGTSPSITIRLAPTTTQASAGSVVSGAPIPVTVGVTSTFGAPAGTVTIAEGAAQLASVALQNGSGTASVPALAPGSHTLTATYIGNSTHDRSSMTLVVTVPP